MTVTFNYIPPFLRSMSSRGAAIKDSFSNLFSKIRQVFAKLAALLNFSKKPAPSLTGRATVIAPPVAPPPPAQTATPAASSSLVPKAAAAVGTGVACVLGYSLAPALLVGAALYMGAKKAEQVFRGDSPTALAPVEAAPAGVAQAPLPALSAYQEEGLICTMQTLGTLSITTVTPQAGRLNGYKDGQPNQPGTAAIHPLRFLQFLVTRDDLKQNLIDVVNYNRWTPSAMIASTFKKELNANLKMSMDAGTLLPYLAEFAQAIGRPQMVGELQDAAVARDWKRFLKAVVPEYNLA
jgi:hypothetical protein